MANRICRTSEPFLYLSKPMKLFAILSEIRSWNLIFSKDRRITVIFIILVNGRTGCSFLPSSLIFSLIVSQSIRNIIYCKNSCPSLSTTFFGTALRGGGQNPVICYNPRKLLVKTSNFMRDLYTSHLINFQYNL